jgi:hypothetical protein
MAKEMHGAAFFGGKHFSLTECLHKYYVSSHIKIRNTSIEYLTNKGSGFHKRSALV